MLNIAVRGHDIGTVKTIEELAERVKQTGIQSIQLALGISFPNVPSEKQNVTPGMGNYFCKKLAEKDVQVGVLSCYVNLIHPDLAERQRLLAKFDGYLKVARDFGAGIVATETGGVYPDIRYTTENFTEQAFLEVVQSVEYMTECAANYGLLVGIEPGLNHPIYSVAKTAELIQAVDSKNLGIILDPTNLITNDTYLEQIELIEEAFASFGDKIIAIHLKDFIIEDNQLKIVPVGTGIMNIAAFVKILLREKPYIHVILEETSEAYMISARKHVEQMIQELQF
ncbi:sugar phosphate isomerase/epimerase family protein [Carnobacterium gallinarum]|uniref:sugar phosphate isomerase/epimerase family protein n=1 Tax=Carnobacterium gallinarum TaxID=2749 RepID=UPI00054FD137|nr:sugar phosphate isomerase/epimerase family protein [Carnobacterium gallinarum]